MNTDYHDLISIVIDGFDFEKVHAYMTLTKWQWADSVNGAYYSPTIDQLKDVAIDCLCQVTKEGKSLIGRGGFCAYRFEYGIKLTFEPFRSASF